MGFCKEKNSTFTHLETHIKYGQNWEAVLLLRTLIIVSFEKAD